MAGCSDEGGEEVSACFLDLRGDVRVGAYGVDADEGAFEFKHGKAVSSLLFPEQTAFPALRPA